jgi:hypothetical protein
MLSSSIVKQSKLKVKSQLLSESKIQKRSHIFQSNKIIKVKNQVPEPKADKKPTNLYEDI